MVWLVSVWSELAAALGPLIKSILGFFFNFSSSSRLIGCWECVYIILSHLAHSAIPDFLSQSSQFLSPLPPWPRFAMFEFWPLKWEGITDDGGWTFSPFFPALPLTGFAGFISCKLRRLCPVVTFIYISVSQLTSQDVLDVLIFIHQEDDEMNQVF